MRVCTVGSGRGATRCTSRPCTRPRPRMPLDLQAAMHPAGPAPTAKAPTSADPAHQEPGRMHRHPAGPAAAPVLPRLEPLGGGTQAPPQREPPALAAGRDGPAACHGRGPRRCLGQNCAATNPHSRLAAGAGPKARGAGAPGPAQRPPPSGPRPARSDVTGPAAALASRRLRCRRKPARLLGAPGQLAQHIKMNLGRGQRHQRPRAGALTARCCSSGVKRELEEGGQESNLLPGCQPAPTLWATASCIAWACWCMQ
jgi:hypothetical protein